MLHWFIPDPPQLALAVDHAGGGGRGGPGGFWPPSGNRLDLEFALELMTVPRIVFVRRILESVLNNPVLVLGDGADHLLLHAHAEPIADILMEPSFGGDDYEPVFNDRGIPDIELDDHAIRHFIAGADTKTRGYVSAQVSQARWFLAALRVRKTMLISIARSMMSHGADFAPTQSRLKEKLCLQTIADHVNIHVSSVSRSVRNKTILSHFGCRTLGSFFEPVIYPDQANLISL